MAGKVLVLGANGKIGSHAVRAFGAAGWDVARWQRGTPMGPAARGADVIVNGLNPPAYHDWARQVPAMTAEVIAAARETGARVIVPGNIYNFGLHPGELSEQTPQQPQTRKGRIRAEMEAAYRASGVPTLILRAGNFIDPLGNGDVMALLHLRALSRGTFTLCGNPQVRQAYAYVPDWARAAVALAELGGQLPQFADVPFPGHTFTGADLQAQVEAILGRRLIASRFPWGMMRLAAPFWELARELMEMRYLWDMDHWLSGCALAAFLPGFAFTPADEMLRTRLASPS